VREFPYCRNGRNADNKPPERRWIMLCPDVFDVDDPYIQGLLEILEEEVDKPHSSEVLTCLKKDIAYIKSETQVIAQALSVVGHSLIPSLENVRSDLLRDLIR
jgi:hypothetical protein